jgi:hypothetical protein
VRVGWGQKVGALGFFYMLSFLFAWQNMSHLWKVDGVVWGVGGFEAQKCVFQGDFAVWSFFWGFWVDTTGPV